MQRNVTCRLQSQVPERDVMVSKVQPELTRQCSVNKLLGANSMALQNGGAAAHSTEVMHIAAYSVCLLLAIYSLVYRYSTPVYGRELGLDSVFLASLALDFLLWMDHMLWWNLVSVIPCH